MEISPHVCCIFSPAYVSIGLFLFLSVRFRTMQYVLNCWSFLLVTSELVKKVPMETESYIYLGGTIILLALFAQRYIFGQRYTQRKYTPLYKIGTKQNQNEPMETTLALVELSSRWKLEQKNTLFYWASDTLKVWDLFKTLKIYFELVRN